MEGGATEEEAGGDHGGDDQLVLDDSCKPAAAVLDATQVFCKAAVPAVTGVESEEEEVVVMVAEPRNN